MRPTCRLIVLALALAAAAPLHAGPPQDGVEAEVVIEDILQRAEGAAAADDLDGALAILDAGLASLPAGERMVIWEHGFDGLLVHGVLMGTRHVYLLAHVHRWTRHPFASLPGGEEIVDSDVRYDFQGAAICLDAVTGRPLWHRRTSGAWQAVVDPDTDDLLIWRRDLVRLSADTGAEASRVEIGDDWPRLDGLLLGGGPLVPRPRTRGMTGRAPDPACLFDVHAKRFTEPDLPRYHGLSPDESRIARLEGGVLVVRDLETETELWRHEHAGGSTHAPAWLDGDVLWRGGRGDGPGTLSRFDGATGEVRWRHVLARGSFDERHVELPGNHRPTVEWDTLGVLGTHLYLVEGDGSIHVLDPATGEAAASLWPVRQPMAPPLAVENVLVVAGGARIRGVPLAPALAGRTPGEIRLRAQRARVLLRRARRDEALAEVRRITDAAALDPSAWLARADVASRAGAADEALAARCRWMALTGTRTVDALRVSHGLLARIPIGGDVTASLASVPNRVVVGTRGGRLLHVDPLTLEIRRDEVVPEGITRLRLRRSVSGGGALGPERTLWSDEERDPDPARTPAAWFTLSGYDGRAVRDGPRWIRPLAGGGVRILDDETVVEHAALPGELPIRRWDLHLHPGRPLGYGTGGVYGLDEHHRPREALVTYVKEARTDMRPKVQFLASDGETFAVVVQHGRTSTLEVRDPDGGLLASEEIGYPGYVEGATSRLRAVAGGYLFVGDRLVWLRAGATPRAWRFDPAGPQGDAVPLTRFVHTAFFTTPVLRDGRLFVGCRDGGLYVFDVAAISR